MAGLNLSNALVGVNYAISKAMALTRLSLGYH
jgi:hypothetical protein